LPIKIGTWSGDFDSAVNHIKKTKPDISDPAAYVASIMHNQEIQEDIKIQGQSFPDFEAAKKYVKQNMPHIENPDGYVGSIMRRGGGKEASKLYTPEEAGYVQSVTPRKCSTCEYFQYPSKCNLPLKIPVDPELGCCNFWNPKEKSLGDIINQGKMQEAHTSMSYYGTNMNSELDEDSYMKRSLAFLSAAVNAHNMENQRPEMEGVENDYLKAAKVMLDKAWQVHQKEYGISEITTLDDIPTPTHGSSGSTSNMDWMGHNMDPQGIWTVIKTYLELKNRGIPDMEAMRVLAMQYGVGRINGTNTQYQPSNTNYWPLKKTGGMDTVDRIYPNLIPSEAFSPPLPPHLQLPEIESVAISGNLSGVSIGAKPEQEGLWDDSVFPQVLPPLLDNTNYVATGNMPNSEPSMHNEEGWVGQKQIPEESFYDPMNKSWGKRKAGIPQQPNKISSQIVTGDSSYSPNDGIPGESETVVPRDQVLPDDNPVMEPGKKEAMGYPPLKLRQMGKFVYSNHGHTSKYQEHKGMHICEQLNNTVWDMEDKRRPILPSENAGITNTHPNCTCLWEHFTQIDPDPTNYGSALKPTLNGQALADFNWKGKALDHIDKINNKVSDKYQMGTLHKLDKDGKVGGLMETECMKKKRRTITEASELHEQFKWVSPEYVSKLKAMEKEVGGKFFLVRAAVETITDHRSEGEQYRRKLDATELWGLTRTGIGKGIDINHDPRYKTDGYIVDGEFDPNRKEVQYIVHESDPQVLQAIANGTIDAVSINGGAPRSEHVAPCDSTGQELCLHPRGVILGEQDGIGFTWVVVNPEGMNWKGIHMNAASPGVKKTAIQSL